MFIRIHNNKNWSDHACSIIHGFTFVTHDPRKPKSINTRALNVGIMNT